MTNYKTKLIEPGIGQLPNGKYKSTITYKKNGKYTNKSKTVNTVEEARKFRADFKPESSIVTKRTYNRKPVEAKQTSAPVFQQIELPNSDSFMLVIAKNPNVLDSIIARFL